MRSYPRNSPEAAARIVALALIADCHVSGTELDALTRADAAGELGLAPDALHHMLHTVCEDIACCAGFGGASLDGLDDAVLASIVSELTDADLQRKVLALVLLASSADGVVADGESRLLELLRAHWQPAAAAGPSRACPALA